MRALPGDGQLFKLFTVMDDGTLSEQAKAILLELLERGYIYDPRQGKFLSSHQWKRLYQDMSPADYFADLYTYLRQRNKPPDVHEALG